MEFWTHKKTMFIFIALKGFVTKSYMDMYVSNQWTHGQLDAQQNSVSLFNVYPRLDKSLHFDIQSTGQKSHCVNISL